MAVSSLGSTFALSSVPCLRVLLALSLAAARLGRLVWPFEGSSAPGLPRLPRCLAESLRPSGPRSWLGSAGRCTGFASSGGSPGRLSRLRPCRAPSAGGGASSGRVASWVAHSGSCGLERSAVHCRPGFPFRRPACQHPGLACRLSARAVGDQVGAKLRSHVAARRVMLAQEARQRSRRDCLQQTARALVAGVAGAGENLGRAFAGLEILRLRPRGRAARQPIRSVTVAKMSARLNIPYSPDAEIASSALSRHGWRRSPFSRLSREWKRTYDATA